MSFRKTLGSMLVAAQTFTCLGTVATPVRAESLANGISAKAAKVLVGVQKEDFNRYGTGAEAEYRGFLHIMPFGYEFAKSGDRSLELSPMITIQGEKEDITTHYKSNKPIHYMTGAGIGLGFHLQANNLANIGPVTFSPAVFGGVETSRDTQWQNVHGGPVHKDHLSGVTFAGAEMNIGLKGLEGCYATVGYKDNTEGRLDKGEDMGHPHLRYNGLYAGLTLSWGSTGLCTDGGPLSVAANMPGLANWHGWSQHGLEVEVGGVMRQKGNATGAEYAPVVGLNQTLISVPLAYDDKPLLLEQSAVELNAGVDLIGATSSTFMTDAGVPYQYEDSPDLRFKLGVGLKNVAKLGPVSFSGGAEVFGNYGKNLFVSRDQTQFEDPDMQAKYGYTVREFTWGYGGYVRMDFDNIPGYLKVTATTTEESRTHCREESVAKGSCTDEGIEYGVRYGMTMDEVRDSVSGMWDTLWGNR